MIMDGGINRPRVPAPANDPTASLRSYPRFHSVSDVIFPMVIVVAVLEPEMAAKSVQPKILVCNRRPGNHCIHGMIPRNMRSAILVRNSNSPIQINKGIHANSQLTDFVHKLPLKIANTLFKGMSATKRRPNALASMSAEN